MNIYMNTTTSPHFFIAGQPNAVHLFTPQPLHEISLPRPITTSTPAHQDIARRNYQIYVQNGYPQAQSEPIWKQTEREHLDRGLSACLSMHR